MKENYQLAIVDDHPVVTEGLAVMLSRLPNITIAAKFKNGNSILDFPELGKLDIVLLDVFLPDVNGIDVCIKLKRLRPKLIILAMSSQAERSMVMQMIKNGAVGYLLKSATLEEFKTCIDMALAGTQAFSNEVKEIVNAPGIRDLRVIPRLTRREKEILELLIKGKSTQEISDALFLSYLTVQTHRRNLLNKFQVKNAVELINFAKENALL
jgi:DNA-binding NarL/FixJ family response regulator